MTTMFSFVELVKVNPINDIKALTALVGQLSLSVGWGKNPYREYNISFSP